MALQQKQLNEYGKYFFSQENVLYLNQQLQILFHRARGVVITPQPPKIIYDFQRRIYNLFGHYRFPTDAENKRLIELLNIETLKLMLAQMVNDYDMKGKQIQRRERRKKLVNQPVLSERQLY